MLQRDAFIEEIIKGLNHDKSIYFFVCYTLIMLSANWLLIFETA